MLTEEVTVLLLTHLPTFPKTIAGASSIPQKYAQLSHVAVG
ncbi:hypothetical protein [Pumilibacter muris]|nr:hypothetical protein [Pumilibacter muris]